ncbi:hypothetical protein SAMN05660462_00545 [Proteiniborus ethanoligenes]|uniref:Uncharacterized protein n=1 Tax=Proteiniborus ethanoligenes TaxID=415015 RepID=A0A1H3LLT0_9FIRM|nr:hypothetical protein [Proteiniborus ethanoligenes]SDY65089.1 hypothetical protein SAMN05660462_00545 [Proteiniborus ethanoligenes]
MKNKRIFYTGLVIILTMLTVGVILSMRIVEDRPDVYDKLDTEIRYGNSEKVGDIPYFLNIGTKSYVNSPLL